MNDLRIGLMLVADSLTVAFTTGELDRILRLTLPDLLPGALDLHSYPRIDDHGDGLRVRNDRLLARVLSNEQQRILLWKLAGLDDGQVGDRLGIPRRTATYRKSRVYAIVEETLGPLGYDDRVACVDRVCLDHFD